jgi:hypothetical protein
MPNTEEEQNPSVQCIILRVQLALAITPGETKQASQFYATSPKFIFFIYLIYWAKVFLCCLRCPGTYCVAQAGFEGMILLPPSPECYLTCPLSFPSRKPALTLLPRQGDEQHVLPTNTALITLHYNCLVVCVPHCAECILIYLNEWI